MKNVIVKTIYMYRLVFRLHLSTSNITWIRDVHKSTRLYKVRLITLLMTFIGIKPESLCPRRYFQTEISHKTSLPCKCGLEGKLIMGHMLTANTDVLTWLIFELVTPFSKALLDLKIKIKRTLNKRQLSCCKGYFSLSCLLWRYSPLFNCYHWITVLCYIYYRRIL